MTWTKVNPAGTRSPKSSPKIKLTQRLLVLVHLVPKKVDLSKKKYSEFGAVGFAEYAGLVLVVS